MTIRIAMLALAAALAFAPIEAGAFLGGGDSQPTTRPGASDFNAGKKAAKAGDHRTAVDYLAKAAAADPKNADAFNLLGYSYRKLGDVEAAFKHYRTALGLKPTHRGANEYIGELYLEVGDLAKAEAHLEVLDDACFFGCPEYTDLKAAVTAYKAKHGG